jgi:hypothetical protein
MSLLQPLALLFGLSLPVLILFYLLKVRRRPRRVASTWLWRRAIEDARASVPFQRLRRNLLLLLQLLILAALTLALARPMVNRVAREAGTLVILIDRSASMGMRAREGGRTRLDEARDKARQLIASMPPGGQAMVLAFADRAEVLSPPTADRSRLNAALADLTPSATGEEPRAAFSLAGSLIGAAPNPRVVVLTDSLSPDEETASLLGAIPIAIEPCGEPAPNVGWTALDLRRASPTSNFYDLFGRIAAHEGPRRAVNVEIETDGRLIEARRVELTPGEETPLVIEKLSIDAGAVLTARLSPEGGGPDALGDDDVFVAELDPTARLRLLLCTPGNDFLALALRSAGPIEIFPVAPGATAPEGEFDLAIYDRELPANPPNAPALYIGRSPWRAPGVEPEEVPAGEITNWDTQHPISASVQWSTVTVYGAMTGETPAEARALVESAGIPLVFLGRADNQVAIYVAFDLFRSNFPLRAGFPIFVKNAVNWLTRDRPAREVRAIRGGEAYTAPAPGGVGRVEFVSPSGRVVAARIGEDRRAPFAETNETGLWSVRFDGREVERFGVNLLDAGESDPAVVEARSIDAEGRTTNVGLEEGFRSNREVWKWFALAALAILVLEWVFYQRRVAV